MISVGLEQQGYRCSSKKTMRGWRARKVEREEVGAAHDQYASLLLQELCVFGLYIPRFALAAFASNLGEISAT